MAGVDWGRIEAHEQWAVAVSTGVLFASEDAVEDGARDGLVCPVCRDRFMDNKVLNFPRGDTRNLVHKECFVGFLALHRACQEGGGGGADGAEKRGGRGGGGAKKKDLKKDQKTPRWPEAGSVACEQWLSKHLPAALYNAPSPEIKPQWSQLQVGVGIMICAVAISFMGGLPALLGAGGG